jgi:penicillin-binding protein 1A
VAALAMVVGAGVYYVYFDRSDVPDVDAFIRFEAPTIGEVYDTDGHVLIELAREYRRILTYREVPPVVRNAVLDAEDAEFFCHSGVDYASLPRVLWKTLAHSAAATRRVWIEEQRFKPVLVFPQGGSTITQQLVRGFFLRHLTSRENDGAPLGSGLALQATGRLLGVPAANKFARKLEEIRLSLWLEEELERKLGSKQAAKEAILARYASFIYMGHGRYGLGAAAEFYFGKPLATLTDVDADKAAMLAGITKSPRSYAPADGNVERPLRRRNHILASMARSGALTPSAADRLRQAPLVLAARSKVKTEAPAVVENVFRELEQLEDERLGVGQFVQGRIRVYSTVNREIQRIVNEALEEGLAHYEERHPESSRRIQGSVVVLHNADARILAEAGGRQVFRDRYNSYSDYNRVTDSWRQPGSVMKPLVYLAAFREGLVLDDVVPDAPIAVPMGGGRAPKWIQNYDRRFKGPIPVRQALAESRNAATIWIARTVGMQKVLSTARTYGISSRLQPYITTALGASEVRLLELANAYRAMASGRAAEPYVIDRVTDSGGAVLFTNRPKAESLDADAFALRQIQEGLRGVIRLPGGTAHSLDSSEFSIPVMGKTGTSSEFRDALFVGSTYGPNGITVAVRIGYDDNRMLGDKETGGRTALPIFRAIMAQVYERKLVRPLPAFPEEMERHIDQYMLYASATPPSWDQSGTAVPGDAPTVVPVDMTAPIGMPVAPAGPAPGTSGDRPAGVAATGLPIKATILKVTRIEAVVQTKQTASENVPQPH